MQLTARSHRFRAGVALLFACTLAATSCGTDSEAAEPTVDLAQLDVGGYATLPRDLGEPKNKDVPRFVEAQRLGNVIPLPVEIDPKLVYQPPGTVRPFLLPDESHPSPIHRWIKEDNFANDAKGFISGFSATGSSNKVNSIAYTLSTSVLIFPDAKSATDAAANLSRAGFYEDDKYPVEPAKLEKYPAAHVRWQPGMQVLASWLAQDEFVIVTIASDYEKKVLGESDLPGASALLEKAIAATSTSLEKFEPTPPDKFMETSIDPDGMRSISLRRPEGDSFLNVPGTYDMHGSLHFPTDPLERKQQLVDAGVDRVAYDAGDLYRAADAESAQELKDKSSELNRYFRSQPSPKGLPQATCTEYKGPAAGAIRFYCHVTYDRYYAFMAAEQLLDAQQRISAQYAILANSK
ncbi:hypothetical protein GV794_16990 [Nocardia cyriacigeorgica]|uniref:Uncharacterized protein n=1 Tax=Nocardia cyriacigeorgica TaxID=135487 RepID=A0A6P1DI32_9NOCA|nr:hypothetical protein [Nocardia cyriacigeorgica]NEW39098.1 hypothetical protein [Nocardia cyriacigeorgica]NEW48062.1 hypothetical protein [Nocardia cyriacigeorgica]NEW52734.1 hypothetical protein [Nocardia cyriacigeorgica]NEW57338.1 hypothetical protein [Nocardia cyriacigeorgica]